MSIEVKTYTVFVLVALLTWWFAGIFTLPELQTHSAGFNSVDYYANDLVMDVANEMGYPKYQLIAASMTHYEDKDVTQLDKPIVTIFDAINPPWVIRSKSGTVSADGRKVFLGGTVYIDRERSDNTRPINVVTRDLHVEPERRYAETDKRARIVSKSDRVVGTGMRVFFSNPLKLTLLSKVKGKYEVR